MERNCYYCVEANKAGQIEKEEIQPATTECYICRKPVCVFHSGPDGNNPKIRICDDCSGSGRVSS